MIRLRLPLLLSPLMIVLFSSGGCGANEQHDALRAQNQRLAAARDRLRDEGHFLRQQLADANQDLAQARRDLAAVRSELRRGREEMNRLVASAGQMRSALGQAQRTIERDREELSEMRARLRMADVARDAAAASPNTTPAVGEEGRYIVAPGDSLSRIAHVLYGDSGRWREILEANRATISNPNRIEPGLELLIPQ